MDSGRTPTLNFIPLWDLMWCHRVPNYVRQAKYAHTVASSQEYAWYYKKAQLKCSCACGDALLNHIHSRSGIKFILKVSVALSNPHYMTVHHKPLPKSASISWTIYHLTLLKTKGNKRFTTLVGGKRLKSMWYFIQEIDADFTRGVWWPVTYNSSLTSCTD